MTPENLLLIQQWGYSLIFAASIIEGETFLIFAGAAASIGILKLEWLVCLSVIGSLIHDLSLFYLGKYLGKKVLKIKPLWKEKIDKISTKINRYQSLIILSLRFAYGLRTIMPFALGITQCTQTKFIFLDFLGAVIWVLFFLLGGYFFGGALNNLLKNLSVFSIFTLVLFVIISLYLLCTIIIKFIYFLKS